MTLEYEPIQKAHSTKRWLRRAKLFLLIAVGITVSGIVTVACITHYFTSRENARFERQINALNLIGKTPQQVTTVLGKPVCDTLGDGSSYGIVDRYFCYEDPWAGDCCIGFRGGVAIKVDFHHEPH